jgi:hypothetical protein
MEILESILAGNGLGNVGVHCLIYGLTDRDKLTEYHWQRL